MSPFLKWVLRIFLDDCPDKMLCTEEEVYNLLSSLDVSKSSGHDNISARMLMETALSMTSIVIRLFNISISLMSGKWPAFLQSPSLADPTFD